MLTLRKLHLSLTTALITLLSAHSCGKNDKHEHKKESAPAVTKEKAEEKKEEKDTVKESTETSKSSSFSPEQRKEINGIVTDLINQNPDVVLDAIRKNPMIIIDAMKKLQDKQAQEEKEKMNKVVSEHKSEIFAPDNMPFDGNKDAKVVFVVFSDYNCGYCRMLYKSFDEVLKNDQNKKDVKVIHRLLPILSKESQKAARAALAANKQGKFAEFHQLISAYEGKISEKEINEVAGKIKGLDVEKLKADMDSAEIKEAISKNRDLATKLGVTGTPTVYVGDTVVVEAMDEKAINEIIQNVRSGKPATSANQ